MPEPKPAPIWRRLAALGYDLFIIVAISFAYGAIATAIAVQLGTPAQQDYTPMLDGLIYPLGWAASIASYYCWCWSKSGQTIGMKTWKIQLQRSVPAPSSHSGVPWKHCLLRSVVAPPLVIAGGLGYWFAYFDPQRRSLQDRLTNTQISLVD